MQNAIVVGDLLKVDIDEKQTCSIKYQMAVAKLPLAKELAGFDSTGTPINDDLVLELSAGSFLEAQDNVVYVRAALQRACRIRRAREAWDLKSAA